MGEFRSDSLRLVSLLIGQGGFEDLLIMLPDEFFGLDADGKAWVWDRLLGEVNQGVTDPARLAQTAMALVDVPHPGPLPGGEGEHERNC